MSTNQHRIEHLIAELCPNGVEFKELGKVLKRTKGTPITAGQMSKLNKEGAPIKIFAGGKTVAHVNYGDIPDKDVLKKESIVVKSRGYIGFEFINTPFSHKNEFWSYYSDDLTISIKYVYYYLKAKEPYFQSIGKKMTKMPQLSIPDTNSFRIPLPPLLIQAEIVNILDTFTELESKLKAELEARQEQYEYYRDELLKSENSTAAKSVIFGDIAKIVRGGSPRPISSYITKDENGVNWIKIGDTENGGKFITHTAQKIKQSGVAKSRFVKKGDFVLSNSMSFGRPYILKIDGCIHDGWLAISEFEQTYNSDYLYHLLSSNFISQMMAQKASNGTVQNLNADIVKSLILPAPPLVDQERISNFLDKFDALVNDISIGLPAELIARRQQFEYFRNKLLTFKEYVR